MYRLVLAVMCALVAVAPATAQTGLAADPHADHMQQPSTSSDQKPAAAAPRNDKLPPDADAATAQLKSSRVMVNGST